MVHAQPETESPNIVIILTDDLGYGDVGAYGATRIRTPNIDALAADGLLFRQGYASANICTPSRAGLLTGRYAIRAGLGWQVITAESEHGLPAGEETIGELAQRGGYATLFIGKWHLGRLPQYSPLNHGFDEFFGVPHSNDMPDFALFDGDDVVEAPVEQRTLTRRYTDRAVDFIVANDDRPFLLFLSHTFPHIPLYASEAFEGQSAAGLYGDTVEEIDWSTGRIVEALKAAGLYTNTLIVFSSDNGPFFEGSTAGVRGLKGSTWEGAYRVPFTVTWPAKIDAASTTDTMVMNIDVLPTVAAAMGVAPSAEIIDGVDLSPVFTDPAHVFNRHLLYFDNEDIVGLRTQRWKLLTHTYYRRSLGAFEKFDQLPGFDSSYPMLLDMTDEEGGAYSYSDRHPDVVAELDKPLQNARREFDPLRTRPAPPTYPE